MRRSTPGTPIRLLVVDDQTVVRAGFSSVLRNYPDLNVVGAVASGEAALLFLGCHSIEVLLLDLHMPGIGGIETLLAIQKLASPPLVIVLSSFEPDEEICRAVEIGAQGYLRKDTSCSEILEAIHTVQSGNCYLPPWIATRISERKPRSNLSVRELEILEMVAKGLTNKEIGHAIQVSHFTVRNHVRSIIAKLEVGGRTEAATVAIQQGILMVHDSFQSRGCSSRSQAHRSDRSTAWLALRSRSREVTPIGGDEKSSKHVRDDRRLLAPTRPSSSNAIN